MEIFILFIVIIAFVIIINNRKSRAKIIELLHRSGVLGRIKTGNSIKIEKNDVYKNAGNTTNLEPNAHGSVELNSSAMATILDRLSNIEKEMKRMNEEKTANDEIFSSILQVMNRMQEYLTAIYTKVNALDKKAAQNTYAQPVHSKVEYPFPGKVRYSYVPEGEDFAESDMSNSPDNTLFKIVQRTATGADFYITPTEEAKKEIFKNLRYYIKWIAYTDQTNGSPAKDIVMKSSGELALRDSVWKVTKKIEVILC